jgi:hypothetical protein
VLKAGDELKVSNMKSEAYLQDENIARALGSGTSPQTLQSWRWSQNQKYMVNGKEWPATNAGYVNWIDPETDLIIAASNYGPKHQLMNSVENFSPSQPPPNLKQWSDVTFLTWKKIVGKGSQNSGMIPAPINILRPKIGNKLTNTVILEVMKRLGKHGQTPKWPGIQLTSESDEFKAVLSTPNGNGAAWLLIQHKPQFGLKMIDKMTIFWTEDEIPIEYNEKTNTFITKKTLLACILQHVVDVPSAEVIGE